MLDAMRRGAGTWIVKIFLGVLVLSFAAWGIGDIFRVSPDTAVATVGDVEISQARFTAAFNRDLSQLQRRFGGNLDAEQARQFGLVQQTLNRLVTEALYDHATHELGLTVSNETVSQEIKGNRAFQNELGTFDANIYEQVLRQNGYSTLRYEAERKTELAREQLFNSITAGGLAPKKMVAQIDRYQRQRRIVEILTVRHDRLPAPATPDEAALVAYHEAHSTRYAAPEFRAITYVVMRPADLLEQVAVDDQEVKEAYDARIAEFTIPEERIVEQILLSDESLAKEISSALEDGDDFYTVAKERAGQEQSQIKLGKLRRGDLPSEVEDAVFALAADTPSQPLQSPFGWHLFRVTEVSPGHQKTFDEAKNQIEGELRLERATDALFELTNKVDDALAGGDTLEEAAESLRLKVTKVAATSAAGRDQDNKPIADLPKLAGFLQTAFQAALGEEPLLQEARDGSYYLVRVDGITAPTVRPLADVRERVIADWQAEKRREAAEAKAKELADRARSGEDMAALAMANDVESKVTEPLTRAELGAKAGLDQAVVATLFEVRTGGIATGNSQTGEAQIVARLKAIDPATASPASDQTSGLTQSLKDSIVNDLLAQFNKALEKSLDVEINDRAANAIFDQPAPYQN